MNSTRDCIVLDFGATMGDRIWSGCVRRWTGPATSVGSRRGKAGEASLGEGSGASGWGSDRGGRWEGLDGGILDGDGNRRTQSMTRN
jgi:hypothetical protein